MFDLLSITCEEGCDFFGIITKTSEVRGYTMGKQCIHGSDKIKKIILLLLPGLLQGTSMSDLNESRAIGR